MSRLKNWIQKKSKHLFFGFLLVAVFSVSIVVRYKHFLQPLSRHHEWLTAHALVTLKVWEQNGASGYFFAPVYNYNNPGDKYENTIASIFDNRGNGYYVSYGPFAFVLPYTIFKIFHIPVSHTSITCFTLCIHFFTALLLYLLLLRLSSKTFAQFSIGAMSVFVMYIFSPGTLWFHGNIYFSEILAQFLLAFGIYVFAHIITSQNTSRTQLIWLGIACFTGVYNEWLGLFFTFFVGMYFLVRTFYDRANLKPFLVSALSGIAALTFITWQYAQIAGFDQLLHVMTTRFAERNGGSLAAVKEVNQEFSIQSGEAFKHIEKYLNDGFVNIFNILAFVVPVFILLSIYRKKIFLTRIQLIVFTLLLLPVLAHHYVFFNFTTVHDFSVLKTGMLLIVLTALLISRIENFAFTFNKYISWGFVGLVSVFLLVKSKHAYEKYDQINNLDTVFAGYQKAGIYIRDHSNVNEGVFSNLTCPLTNAYAMRSVRYDYAGGGVYLYVQKYQMPATFYKVENDVCVSLIHYKPDGDSIFVDLRSGQKP